jgi:hypothetical protein
MDACMHTANGTTTTDTKPLKHRSLSTIGVKIRTMRNGCLSVSRIWRNITRTASEASTRSFNARVSAPDALVRGSDEVQTTYNLTRSVEAKIRVSDSTICTWVCRNPSYRYTLWPTINVMSAGVPTAIKRAGPYTFSPLARNLIFFAVGVAADGPLRLRSRSKRCKSIRSLTYHDCRNKPNAEKTKKRKRPFDQIKYLKKINARWTEV